MSFKPGDAVSYFIKNRHSEFRKGTIISQVPETTDMFVVEWEKRHWEVKSLISKENARKLMPLKEAEETRSRLENEFNTLEAQVKEKVEAAAAFLKEANKLAQDKSEDLHELYEATYPLLRAMDEAGWSTSSLGC